MRPDPMHIYRTPKPTFLRPPRHMHAPPRHMHAPPPRDPHTPHGLVDPFNTCTITYDTIYINTYIHTLLRPPRHMRRHHPIHPVVDLLQQPPPRAPAVAEGEGGPGVVALLRFGMFVRA